ncbi:BON domain-containing protein [Aidingimonas halophila]|uniref:Osmotically-inducible protein OsmY, contains BON domain n=1 Tax=Aidingimonas halophila TaxID=574349 RepID=A0A1H2QU51_9GAMM|nr:BON domain-containing protein [Aidingimonas halophila]GHC20238.1 BON domain-containing protein [Aidingimonas halophila]SDW10696.1 Osmotically-inducible protein OsmY, contains BON domain [Aidingimonas halophila]
MKIGSLTPIVLLSLMLGLSGCTTVANVTNSDTIEENYGKRTIGARVEDESIETKIEVNLSKTDARFDDARVNVDSYNGIVLLTGQVPSEELQEKALDIAEDVRNVRKVHNELSVSANLPAGQRISDGWLSTRIRTALATNENIDASRIRVITENASVYLMGIVTREEGDRIAKAASGINGVQRIVKAFEYLD